MSDPLPHESIPEWRATLVRAAALRSCAAKTFTDEELVRLVRGEFNRVRSQFFGYEAWQCVLMPVEIAPLAPLVRVVVAHPRGGTILRDAPTEAEALGLALAEFQGVSHEYAAESYPTSGCSVGATGKFLNVEARSMA